MALADKMCIPCTGDVPPLEQDKIDELLAELGQGWTLNAEQHLETEYPYEDFAGAMGFASKVAILADLEGHHPDLHVAWGKLRVEIWTHAIDGLTESDFILAAKIQRAHRAG